MDRKKPANSSRNRNKSGKGKGRGQSVEEPMPSMVRKFLSFFGFIEKPATKTKPSAGQKGGKKRNRKVDERPVISPRLFVGNLSYSVESAELEKIFQKAGDVKSAEVVIHPRTNRSKGFGFVTMGSVEDAKKAASMFNGEAIDGREISVTGAKNEGKKKKATPKKTPEARREGKDAKSNVSDEPQSSPRSRSGKGAEKGRERERGGRRGRDRRKESSSGVSVEPMAVPTISSVNLVISNLADDFGSDELSDLFKGVAEIAKSEISGSTAEVELASVEDAQEAVRVLDGKDFMGKTLSVKEGEQKTEAPTD